jgi:hypothetical protein
MASLFEKLNRGRPPRQSKTDNPELTRELQKLHAWLQHRDKPTVSLRDIYFHGLACLRNRKKALDMANILAGHGWLIPERAHQYNRRVWRIVRAHGGYPTVATVAAAASAKDAPRK